MDKQNIKVKLSSNSSMQPIIDRNSIHVARILSGKVSMEALVSLVELLEISYPESYENDEEYKEDKYA